MKCTRKSAACCIKTSKYEKAGQKEDQYMDEGSMKLSNNTSSDRSVLLLVIYQRHLLPCLPALITVEVSLLLITCE